jgi:hypothetical protein
MSKLSITSLQNLVLFFSLFVLASGTPKEKTGKEIYKLVVYHFTDAAQEKMIDNYLENALIPALHRLKIKNVGVFKSLSNDTATAKQVYLFIPMNSLEMLTKLPEKLQADKIYLAAGNEYINAVYTAPPYTRMETIILQAFPMAPVMNLPVLKAAKNERVYELRSYESATEKIFANKVHMFNEGDEIGLFKKLNFNAVFYSQVIAGSKMPNLMYMTSFESMADRDEHWKKFGSDPFWKKLSAMPEYKNNVSHIDITFLHPAEYSDF